MDCVQRAQTSAKASNLNQWSGIRIQIFGLIRKFRIWIRMSAGSRASCCGSITFRRQSFRRVSWKSASDCMRNANKSPIRNSSLFRMWEVENDSESVSRTGPPLTVLPISRSNHSSKFQRSRLITFTLNPIYTVHTSSVLAAAIKRPTEPNELEKIDK